MIQRDLPEIFNDCVNRIAVGWTIDDCLAVYPAYAAQLRPMLEAGLQVRVMRAPQFELIQDQEIVWQRLMESEPYVIPVPTSRNRRGYRVLGQLIAAVFLLILLVGATWFVLNRLIVPPDDRKIPILETLTPTATLTATPEVTATISPTLTETATTPPTTTQTPTLTQTATITTTQTPTLTQTATTTTTQTPIVSATPSATRKPTLTSTPSVTVTATATYPACGAPRTAQDAVNAVMAIYPNTTIISVFQTTKFNGTLVWEVKTSHGVTVNIDVACGIILSIERPVSGGSNTPVVGDLTNTNDNVSGGSGSNSGSGSGGNENSNSNDNLDDSGGGGSGMGS